MKSREQRQEEAKVREQLRAKRTDEEQLARLDQFGWAAKKERARLLKRIEARSNG